MIVTNRKAKIAPEDFSFQVKASSAVCENLQAIRRTFGQVRGTPTGLRNFLLMNILDSWWSDRLESGCMSDFICTPNDRSQIYHGWVEPPGVHINGRQMTYYTLFDGAAPSAVSGLVFTSLDSTLLNSVQLKLKLLVVRNVQKWSMAGI